MGTSPLLEQSAPLSTSRLMLALGLTGALLLPLVGCGGSSGGGGDDNPEGKFEVPRIPNQEYREVTGQSYRFTNAEPLCITYDQEVFEFRVEVLQSEWQAILDASQPGLYTAGGDGTVTTIGVSIAMEKSRRAWTTARGLHTYGRRNIFGPAVHDGTGRSVFVIVGFHSTRPEFNNDFFNDQPVSRLATVESTEVDDMWTAEVVPDDGTPAMTLMMELDRDELEDAEASASTPAGQAKFGFIGYGGVDQVDPGDVAWLDSESIFYFRDLSTADASIETDGIAQIVLPQGTLEILDIVAVQYRTANFGQFAIVPGPGQ